MCHWDCRPAASVLYLQLIAEAFQIFHYELNWSPSQYEVAEKRPKKLFCFSPGIDLGTQARSDKTPVLRMASKKPEERFIENGGLFLEKLIGSWNGRCSPIRSFSTKEIELATNNYDSVNVLIDHGRFKWYKGSIEGRNVSIKKRDDNLQDNDINLIINDIVTSAQMNTHNNILKLIGWCFETRFPITVYEFAENGSLFSRIHISGGTPPPRPFFWKSRLRIATEIASAVAYLHTAFHKPTIHRGITACNIFLDLDNVSKLSGFELSVVIPEGETQVEYTVMGAPEYTSPEYLYTGLVTEKSDIYSFGVLLMELLTGRKPLDDDGSYITGHLRKHVLSNEDNQVLDPVLLEEVAQTGVQQKVQAVLELTLRCAEIYAEERPTMLDVARQLLQLKRTMVDH